MLSAFRLQNSELVVLLGNLWFKVTWIQWITSRASSVLIVNFVSNAVWVHFDPELSNSSRFLPFDAVRFHFDCETDKLGRVRKSLFWKCRSTFWLWIVLTYCGSYTFLSKSRESIFIVKKVCSVLLINHCIEVVWFHLYSDVCELTMALKPFFRRHVSPFRSWNGLSWFLS